MLPTAIVFGLFAAASKVGKSLTAKAAAQATDEYIATATMRIGTAVVLCLLVLLVQGELQHSVSTRFWMALGLNTLLLGLLAVLVTRAYKISDVSLVAPLLGLSPIMTILPSMVLTDETFSLVGLLGVFVTSIGGFIALSGGDISRESLDKSIRDRGVQLIAIVLLFIGFIGPLDKIGISQTSPLFWSMIINLTGGSLVVILAVRYSEDFDVISEKSVLLLVGLSMFNAGIWVGQAFAYELTNVAYVQSLKQGSILIAVVVGSRIYGEENMKSRLIGSLLIVAGVVILSLVV